MPSRLYGDWNPDTGQLGCFANWRDALAQWEAKALKRADAAMPPAKLASVRAWLREHATAIPTDPERVLVHGDLGLQNTLLAAPVRVRAESWQITGLLDFEESQIAPPALDLVPLLYTSANPISPSAFLAGYRQLLPITTALLQQTHYYQMLYHIELLVLLKHHYDGAGSLEHWQGIDRLLAKQPIWGFQAASFSWPF